MSGMSILWGRIAPERAGGRRIASAAGLPPAGPVPSPTPWSTASMRRKWTVLAAATLASTPLVLGGIAAADEDSPLGKIMAKVQAKETMIKKAYRSQVTWSKGQKDAVSAAEDLAKLGKEAKVFEEPAKEKKQPKKDWDDKMDAF